MTPTPQEKVFHTMPTNRTTGDGETVVISGMAGLYPKARYVKDLENILYNKINPVSSDELRWTYNHPEAAQYTGNVPDLNRFDALFFKVHARLALTMEPMSRKLLEQAFEAIYDAGTSPEHLKGKKIGVYVGTCFSETEKATFYGDSNSRGFGIAGCSKAMFANRISYWLNAKGPSVSIDQACCSSAAALEAAYKSITQGECEAAIVGGANLCIHPQSSVHYGRIMNISKDGKSKPFAEDADGVARSEAISVLFLQKLKNAKRRYADVVHVKSEYISMIHEEAGPKYGFYRNPADTVSFLRTFYEDAGVSPALVQYVEAFGSAVPEADKSELEAIDEVFCRKRSSPLLVGSVSSNIGYGEAATGLSSVIKVLLGYHKGLLAGNLHCAVPRSDVNALQDGRIQILSDHHQLSQASYTAVNNMSVSGVNAHVLLKGCENTKDPNRYKCSIPRLVTISGRTEPAVNRAIDILKTQPLDPEQIALLHNIHEKNIAGHLGKGYIVLDTNSAGETYSMSHQVEYCDDARRPLWFVYSGMGSQWTGMGTQLMRVPVFAAAIERCRKVLEPKGLDIVNIITSPDKSVFDNILHSFVGIAAIQIGLTDTLLALGLVPDNIIGHSVGELGCGYADGCLTAEETILCAYNRGRVSLETPFIRGSMAAVGLGAKQVTSMCPPEIQVACHNSANSCTISGPAEAMALFVNELSSRSIFAKEVPCSNIAYHSRYIAEAGPNLLKYLKEVIKAPKLRSERWVSTSVPQDKWNEPTATYCSAEYQTNNLLSPVLFEEASELIPPTAVVVEVAPHGLLQAILKRALPPTVTNIPLTRRGDSDGVLTLLNAVGKLYLCGFNSQVRMLYPEVQFPVSNGTPFLSYLIEWSHEESWPLALYQTAHRTMTATCSFIISAHDDGNYLMGNVVGNKTVLPFSYALVAVWDVLAMTLGLPKKSISIRFEDLKLFAQPILHEQKVVRLSVSLQRGSGMFEVMDGPSRVATGYILKMDYLDTKTLSQSFNTVQELEEQDVYRILYQRGYAYSGEFRSIHNTDASITNANILWKDNWVTLLDGLFQLNTLKYTNSGIAQLGNIRKLVIDVNRHQQTIKESESYISAHLSEIMNRTSCGGVVLENISFRNVLQVNKNSVSLLTRQFVPRYHTIENVSTSLRVLLQIAAENIKSDCINVLGLKTNKNTCTLFEEMNKLTETGLPRINIKFSQKSVEDIFSETDAYQSVDVILIQNLSKNEKIINRLQNVLQTNKFVINEEATGHQVSYHKNNIVSVLTNINNMQLELICFNPIAVTSFDSTLTITSEKDLPKLQKTRSNLFENSSILILTSYPPVNGLMRLVHQWKKESTRNNVSVFMVGGDKMTMEEAPNYNLAFNIFNDNVWGGEYYLPLEDSLPVKENMLLQSKVVGDFSSLHWIQAPESLKGGTMTVAVSHMGLNMGDVRKVLGLTSHMSAYDGYGMDFSGVTKRNERVMGVTLTGAASKYVTAQPELMWPVPQYWSLEDAATVPFAYMYAYYCLFIKTSKVLEDVEYSVLVHGGTGALGQAAISIALARGWRVFTTVRDTRKKRLLMKLFPKLNESDIGNSRDIGFKDMVLSATNGEGCNVVLCNLRGELKDASLSCCKFSGTVVDTAQIITNENYTYGMYNMTKSRSYVTADITSVFADLHSVEIKLLRSLMTEGIASGEVRPLSRVTFDHNEAVRAFRLLAASHHCGRVLLRITDHTSPGLSKTSAAKTLRHIVISEPSPLGLQAVEKLIDFGVQKLHVHINGPPAAYLQYKQRIWKKQNVDVTVTYGTLTSVKDISDALRAAAEFDHVEGVHVVAENARMEAVINTIDSTSRRLFPTLKHFVIISNDSYRGHSACVHRAKAGLPASLLDISLLKTYEDPDGSIWYRGVEEAVDLTRRCGDTMLIALPKQSPDSRLSLIQHLADLTGLRIDSNTPKDESLEQLGLSEERISSLCAFLRDMYNISLPEHDIPHLTIERLQQIEERMYDIEFYEVKGLDIFYSSVDPDELRATTDMVFLPTLTHNNAMRDDEFDMKETYLMIVPGLEGTHARFQRMCERLKLPAFVLQPGIDHLEESPRDLALRYFQVLQKKVSLQNKFYILGYETGITAALELATLLENQGFTGTVFALGDGPSEILELLESTLGEFPSEEALQEALVLHMYKLMVQTTDTASLENALQSASSWNERKNECVRLLLGSVSHSAQYTHSLLEACYGRIKAALRFRSVSKPLRSRIVLLRSGADNSNSLKNYSKNVTMHNFDTPLAHIAEDLRVSVVINTYLDDEVLQAYENKNLCDANLINANSFMMKIE